MTEFLNAYRLGDLVLAVSIAEKRAAVIALVMRFISVFLTCGSLGRNFSNSMSGCRNYGLIGCNRIQSELVAEQLVTTVISALVIRNVARFFA